MTANPTLTLSLLAAGALALSGAGAAQAQAGYGQSVPYGSFTTSCRDVEVQPGGYVSAVCRADGGWRWSAIRYVDCRGDLSNRDGVLSCWGASATTGPFYPDEAAAYPAEPAYPPPADAGPGDVLGALLGALFGEVFGDDRSLDDDWARGRRPLNERRGALEARIDAGVRDGSISYAEASRLRADFDALVRLEARYAADGRITAEERDDLGSRYRILSRRVDAARDDRGWDDDDRDWDDGYWRPIRDRRAEFDARVEAAVRDRALGWSEARRLDAEFEALVRQETSYARGGLDRSERAALERSWDALMARIPGSAWVDPYGPYDPYGGGWIPMSARQAEFEARVDAAVRARAIDWSEATRLREDFRALVRREAEFQRDGLSASERTDLAARYAELQRRLGDQGVYPPSDDPYGRPQAWSEEARRIEARIVAAERAGTLDRGEAVRLRAELDAVVRLEADYARNGLTTAERDDLRRRYAAIEARLRSPWPFW